VGTMNRSIDAPQPERIAELLADLGPRRVERVAQGGSTWVYRVTLAGSGTSRAGRDS